MWQLVTHKQLATLVDKANQRRDRVAGKAWIIRQDGHAAVAQRAEVTDHFRDIVRGSDRRPVFLVCVGSRDNEGHIVLAGRQAAESNGEIFSLPTPDGDPDLIHLVPSRGSFLDSEGCLGEPQLVPTLGG